MEYHIDTRDYEINIDGHVIEFYSKNNSIDEYFTVNRNQFQYSEWVYGDGYYVYFNKLQIKFKANDINDCKKIMKILFN